MTAFDPSLLPEPPDLIPADLRQLSVDNTGWTTRVPPQAVGMFIAAVAQWLSAPRMGTKVNVETLDDGWNITVRLPQPETREDLTL